MYQLIVSPVYKLYLTTKFSSGVFIVNKSMLYGMFTHEFLALPENRTVGVWVDTISAATTRLNLNQMESEM